MANRLVKTLAGLALAALIGPLSAGAARAQDGGGFRGPDSSGRQVFSPLLTVDFDRLFSQSAFGQRIAQDFTQERDTLAAENRRIADTLRQEELALTQQRATMAPDVFRAEAEAFDEKTQAIRRAQDAKESALNDMLVDGRAQFLSVTRPILGQVMIESGAVAILDRRSVLLSLSSVDITDVAVSRIDAAIGDGTAEAPETMPIPQIAPELAPDPVPDPAPETVPELLPDLSPEN